MLAFAAFCRLAIVAALLAADSDDIRPASATATTQPAAKPVHLAGRDWTPREIDLSRPLAGYDACFVLLDPQKGEIVRYNATRCAERFGPCSTFKVPNTLIGLETGVLSGPDHLLKWDGTNRNRPELNHDHNLRSAIKDSVLWYFQIVAERIGPARMQAWLDRIDYGNRDISSGQTTFWLGESLKISALEQAEFMCKLQRGDLPFAPRTLDLTRELIVYSTENGATLRGKTGTYGKQENTFGWFVGYVTHGEQVFPFAMNISADKNASGPRTRELCIEILKSQGWY